MEKTEKGQSVTLTENREVIQRIRLKKSEKNEGLDKFVSTKVTF